MFEVTLNNENANELIDDIIYRVIVDRDIQLDDGRTATIRLRPEHGNIRLRVDYTNEDESLDTIDSVNLSFDEFMDLVATLAEEADE